jgi:hypothetical protein
VLEVLERLCRKALMASSLTPAAIYWVVDREKPTLLIDEADTFLPENEQLRGILNSSHTIAGGRQYLELIIKAELWAFERWLDTLSQQVSPGPLEEVTKAESNLWSVSEVRNGTI